MPDPPPALRAALSAAMAVGLASARPSIPQRVAKPGAPAPTMAPTIDEDALEEEERFTWTLTVGCAAGLVLLLAVIFEVRRRRAEQDRRDELESAGRLDEYVTGCYHCSCYYCLNAVSCCARHDCTPADVLLLPLRRYYNNNQQPLKPSLARSPL